MPGRAMQAIQHAGVSRRLFVAAALTTCSLAAGMYVFIRLQATYQMQYDIAQLRLEVQHQRHDIEVWQVQTDHAIADVQTTAYGPLTKKERRPLVVETWSAERDRELRARIHQLELWRLRAEK